jgi:hypothetical protein
MGGSLRLGAALLCALCAVAALGDALWSTLWGTPERFWGVVPLSSMRLASMLALGLLSGLLACVCARGLPGSERGRAALLLGMVCALFLGNGRYVGSNDAAATRLIPFMLVREGRLCFEHSGLVPSALPYWFVPAGEHIVSRYPVATGILAVPAYLPALFGRYDPGVERVHELERLAAALLALVSVACVLAIARRVLPPRDAASVALVYAFGTSVASILSKALWQHVGGAVGFSLALFGLLIAPAGRRAWISVGLGCGIAVAARSTNAVPAAFLLLAAVYALGMRRALGAAAVSGVPVCAQLGYAHYYFGSIAGHGYGAEAQTGWNAVWSEGVLGILLSPGRGLFVYAPCLVFAAVALYRGDAAFDRRVTRCLLCAIASLVLVMGKWWCWWGGRSSGERMTSDVLPLWGVGLALAYKHSLEAGWRRGFLGCAGYAVLVQTLITFVRPGGVTKAAFVDVLSGAWSWRAYAPVSYLLDVLSW